MDEHEKEALARAIERSESGAYTQIGDRLELLTDDEIAMLIGALVVETIDRQMAVVEPGPLGVRELFASIVEGGIAGMELADS